MLAGRLKSWFYIAKGLRIRAESQRKPMKYCVGRWVTEFEEGREIVESWA
jgi:hypothetical protein